MSLFYGKSLLPATLIAKQSAELQSMPSLVLWLRKELDFRLLSSSPCFSSTSLSSPLRSCIEQDCPRCILNHMHRQLSFGPLGALPPDVWIGKVTSKEVLGSHAQSGRPGGVEQRKGRALLMPLGGCMLSKVRKVSVHR